jgi:hypothetical protein
MGGSRFFQNFMASVSVYSPILIPFSVGFVFLWATIMLFQQGHYFLGPAFFLCSLVLFYAALYQYRMLGTPQFGKEITFEPWEKMTVWKQRAIIFFIIAFLFLWLCLTVYGILTHGIHLENVCIGDCDVL